tara:strand:+ start:218 stop:1123 length:906 start_codon:yes stop_codon:yes gene_type:complete
MPMTQAAFETVLFEGDLPELTLACEDSARFGVNERLQLLRDRLMLVAPSPQPFDVVMANARALISCKAPDSAQAVLSRYGPGPGPRRREWLLLSWRAASAALDQERIVLALMRLADGDPARLDGEQLVVGVDEQGLPSTRSALDLLAEAQIASGQSEQAVVSLLAGRTPGVIAARRLGLAAELLGEIEPERSAPLLEAALDQAAAVQAWNQAEDLLRLQLRLELASGGSGERPRERLRRLATRVDDRFTLLDLDQDLPGASLEQRRQLQQQLRSPRDPGGHASLGESPASEAGRGGVDEQP